MDFSEALKELKAGKKLARKGWNGKGMWVALQRPDAGSKNTLPYLYIEYPAGHPAYPNGSRVPWLASQTDLLSEDWEVVGKVLRYKSVIDQYLGEACQRIYQKTCEECEHLGHCPVFEDDEDMIGGTI